jgi:branched-chain amino acid aminotransferase
VDEGIETLRKASEVLLVSTTRDVQGLHRLDDRELAAPGPVTRDAMRVWRQREAEEIDP